MSNIEQKILQRNLSRFIIEDVFNTITEDDILRIKAPNVWVHKGKDLTPGQINALKSEARAFLSTGLWNILESELRWHAQKSTHDKAKTEEDMIAGKLMSYITDIIKTRLEQMTKD